MKENSKKKIKKAESIIYTIVCIILIPILLLNTVIILKSVIDKDQVPSVFGIYPLVVLSDSMMGEFEIGDLIICKKAVPEDINAGDVICFYETGSNGKYITTHRVVDDLKLSQGVNAWITKGDANNANDLDEVRYESLVGMYMFTIEGLGNAVLFLQTTKGLLLCVFLPTFILLAIELLKKKENFNKG